VAVLLLVGGAGVAAYYLWGFVRPIVTSVTEVSEGVKRLGQATDLDRDLTTTTPFTAPATGELTESQVARFIRVQTQVRAALGVRGEAFAAKYRDLTRPAADGAARIPSLPQLISALGEIPDVYLEAWRAQVAAMNVEGFSRDEFSWVRLRVYQAAGLDAVRYDARDLEHALEQMARGASIERPEVTLPDAPAKNRALVKPHTELLATWLGMAVFGL
jgi:hypothetical protein